MRKYIIIITITVSLILPFTVACQKDYKSVVSFIFLDKNTTNNANILDELLEIEEDFSHKNHTIVFYQDRISNKPVSSIVKKFNITQFPGIVIDNKLLKENQSFRKSLEAAMTNKRKIINPHISYELDKKIYTIKYYVCNYNNWRLDNGEVVVYAVEDNNKFNGKFIGVLTKSIKYNVIAGGCHFPEFIEWELPESYDPASIRFIMIVYNNDGSILGACCTSEICTEREEEDEENED